MHLIFEDAGKLHFGQVLSESESAAQVELATGKRVKVKATHQLLPMPGTSAAHDWDEAQALAQELDLDLAWEFAPSDEFGFMDLAREYFQAQPTTAQSAATLLGLHQAPHYFRRLGKGRFKKASAEVVQLALQAMARKKAQQAQVEVWAEQLANGQCPPEVARQLYRILFKPDKGAMADQAVALAVQRKQQPVLEVLRQAGAIASAYDFHWQRFLFEHFPKGIGFPSHALLQAPTDLPLANVQAYSIDDSHTTEIDDALSVQGLHTDTLTIGIHIAAPGLALIPGSDWDTVARARLSTVYMPGQKVTMLPQALIQAFSLDAGQPVPTLSLYVRFDAQTLECLSSETRLERIVIAANLRHDQLDEVVTAEWLQSPTPPLTEQNLPHAQLQALFRVAQRLKQQREQVRGKPEHFHRPDPVFHIERDDTRSHPLSGNETVRITHRPRGTPLDLIVAEAMILANRTWGQWLADLGVPAIYRSQASMTPGIKVRMGTKPLPHAGMGVSCYAWCTSPLRRYSDLVNQWQLLACVKQGPTAALVAPFKPKETDLLAVISAFDSAYSAYNAHQSAMERFWALKYLQQQGTVLLTTQVVRDLPDEPPKVRAEHLPLVFAVLGAPKLNRGQMVEVQLVHLDEFSLEVTAQFVRCIEPNSSEAQSETDLDSDPEGDLPDTRLPDLPNLVLEIEAGQADNSAP